MMFRVCAAFAAEEDLAVVDLEVAFVHHLCIRFPFYVSQFLRVLR